MERLLLEPARVGLFVPQDLLFRTVERLLSLQTQQPKVISRSEVSVLVKRHGDMIRAAEAKEVEQWEDQSDLSKFQVNLIETKIPRHRAAWAIELTAAVEKFLAKPNLKAPKGVTWFVGQWILLANVLRKNYLYYHNLKMYPF